MRAAKYLLLVSVVGFVLAGTLGLAQSGMSMDSVGHMSGCPFMNIPALCNMNPLEHAFTLQSMLTAIPFSGILALIIALLAALSITIFAPLLWSISIDLLEPKLRPPTRTRRFVLRHLLQEVFSNGVLNSKAF